MTTTKVLIRCTASYVHVFKPDSIDGSEPKYSMAILIDKDDKEALESIRKAIKAAYTAGVGTFGGKLPQSWKDPLRDGDLERPSDPVYAGKCFINASSKRKPGIVKTTRDISGKKSLVDITDENEFYSGCEALVSVNFYAFNVSGNKGVAAGLNNILKIRDGEYLGGRTSPESDFGDLDIETEEDDLPFE